MNAKLRWLPILSLAIFLLFCGLTALVLGQEPELEALPTPTPASGAPLGTTTPDSIDLAALPDLIVTNIQTDPAIPTVGQPTQILVTIKNNSSVNLYDGNNFNVDLYIDPPTKPVVNYHQISPTDDLPWGVQWFWVSPAYNPSGSYVLATTWVFTDVGTRELWALVDSDGTDGSDDNGVVTESNEENNTYSTNISVLTTKGFSHATHQDFLTNMASTLENDDPSGVLRLSRFEEPPFFERPYDNGSCLISSSSVLSSDYNMLSPDSRINQVTTDSQVNPNLITGGNGVVIAVWEDRRNGNIDRDIYLRYSTDYGITWQPEVRVNDDAAGATQSNPVVAFSDDGILMVAWQDNRNGDSDIWGRQYQLTGSTLTSVGGNFLVGGAASYNAGEQIQPDIAVDGAGDFHIVWQDKRNGNYDIFATSYISKSGSSAWSWPRRIDDGTPNTQQTSPAIEALDWLQVTGVNYTVAPTPPYTVTVNGVISQPTTVLVATWEDNRNGPFDIAMTISPDGGETFDIDQFITNSPTDGDQKNPDVTLTKGVTTINYTVPVTGGTRQVNIDVPVSQIHTVWEGYSTSGNVDRDIYYSQSQLGIEQNDSQFDFILSVGGPQKINQNDSRAWQTGGPVDQLNPALAAVPCGGDSSEEDWNLFITWADGRNYDDLNYDIYYSLKSTCSEISVDNQMLNDGVRRYNFDPATYTDYDPGHPPSARQDQPSVAADIQLQDSTVSGGYLYLAWQDDRSEDKDIYFARSNLTLANQPPYNPYKDGAGSQISNILDSGSTDSTWFTLAWSAETPASTYVTVQTRLGDTITDVLTSDWYPQRFHYQPQQWDCSAINSGAPLPGYDAPGQHIEDAAGNYWPQARYIQYRVNFYTRDETKTPELYDLTIYYEPNANSAPEGPGGPGNYQIYLPIIMR